MTPTLYGCQFAQPALPNFAALVYPHPRRYSLGWMGEVTMQRQLESAGFQVRPGRRGEGDLHAVDTRTGQVHFIEVKTAMRSTDRKWRFTLYKRGCTDYRNSDLIILLAVLDDFSYISFTVPVAQLGQRSQLCITSHPASYKGWLAPYRQSPASDLLLTPLSMSLRNGEGLGEGLNELLENPLSVVKGV